MKATKIAGGEGWTFWQIGRDVFRAREDAELDTLGHPMGKRWDYFRAIFSWVEDITE